MTLPVPCETEQIEPAQELLVPVWNAAKCWQKLGGSYITDTQLTQVENVRSNTFISNSDAIMQEYLKNHFNEQLNDKVYSTFKELFERINIDSMKVALLKVSIYNSTIAKFIDEINSKYGIALTFTTVIVGNSPTTPGTLGIYQPLNWARLAG